MSPNKTVATDIDPKDFIAGVDHPVRRADAVALDRLFQDLTGWRPKMWGPTIIGYGAYDYRYESGREGTFLATGFSPRKANLSIYVMPGYADLDAELSRLGKHKMGKSCLYINKLADVQMDVLAEIIKKGLTRLETIYPVRPS